MSDSSRVAGSSRISDITILKTKRLQRISGYLMNSQGSTSTKALLPLFQNATVSIRDTEARIVGASEDGNSLVIDDTNGRRELSASDFLSSTVAIAPALKDDLEAVERFASESVDSEKNVYFNEKVLRLTKDLPKDDDARRELLATTTWSGIRTNDALSPDGIIINNKRFSSLDYEDAKTRSNSGDSDSFRRRSTPPAVFVGNWSAYAPEARFPSGGKIATQATERDQASVMWDHIMRTLARRDTATTSMLNDILRQTRDAMDKGETMGSIVIGRSAVRPKKFYGNPDDPTQTGPREEFDARQDGRATIEIEGKDKTQIIEASTDTISSIVQEAKNAERANSSGYAARTSEEEPNIFISFETETIARGRSSLDEIYFVAATPSEAAIARSLAGLALTMSGYDPQKGASSITPFVRTSDLPDQAMIDAWMASCRPNLVEDPQRPRFALVSSSETLDPDTLKTNTANALARNLKGMGGASWVILKNDETARDALVAAYGKQVSIQEASSEFDLILRSDKVVTSGVSNNTYSAVAQAARLGRMGFALNDDGTVLDRFAMENEALEKNPSWLKLKFAKDLEGFSGTGPNSQERLLQLAAIRESIARQDDANLSLSQKDMLILASLEQDLAQVGAIASDKTAAGYGPQASAFYHKTGISRGAFNALASPRVMVGALQIAAEESAAARRYDYQANVQTGRSGLFRTLASGAVKEVPENGVFFADDGPLLPEMSGAARAAIEEALNRGLSPIVVSGSESANILADILEERAANKVELKDGVIPTVVSPDTPDTYILQALNYAADNSEIAASRFVSAAEKALLDVDSQDKRRAVEIAAIDTLADYRSWTPVEVGYEEWAISQNGAVAWRIAPLVSETGGPSSSIVLEKRDMSDGSSEKTLQTWTFEPEHSTQGRVEFAVSAYSQARKLAAEESGDTLSWAQSTTLSRQNPYAIAERFEISVDGLSRHLRTPNTSIPISRLTGSATSSRNASLPIIDDSAVGTIASVKTALTGRSDGESGTDGLSELVNKGVVAAKTTSAVIGNALDQTVEQSRIDYLSRLAENLPAEPLRDTSQGKIGFTLFDDKKVEIPARQFTTIGEVIADHLTHMSTAAGRASGIDRLSPEVKTTLGAFGKRLGPKWDVNENGDIKDDGKTAFDRVTKSAMGVDYRIAGSTQSGAVTLSATPEAIASAKASSALVRTYFKDTDVARFPLTADRPIGTALREAQMIAASVELANHARAEASFDRDMGRSGWRISDAPFKGLSLQYTPDENEAKGAKVIASRSVDGKSIAVSTITSLDTPRIVEKGFYSLSEDVRDIHTNEVSIVKIDAFKDALLQGSQLALDSALEKNGGRAVMDISQRGCSIALTNNPSLTKFIDAKKTESQVKTEEKIADLPKLMEKGAEFSKAVFVSQMSLPSPIVSALSHAAEINSARKDGSQSYPVVTPSPSRNAVKSDKVAGQLLILRGSPQDFASHVTKTHTDRVSLEKLGSAKLARPLSSNVGQTLEAIKNTIDRSKSTPEKLRSSQIAEVA